MAESAVSLRKKTRIELLEMLVEQSRHVAELEQQMEEIKGTLEEKTAELEKLKLKLVQQNSDIQKNTPSEKELYDQMRSIVSRKNRQIESLKKALETERMIRMAPVTSAKTLGEAAGYMNQMLQDTRWAIAQYQKMVITVSKKLDEK